MHRVIVVDLDGLSTPFRMHDDAYDALSRYLDLARSRLADDPDQAEVMGDLEGSVGTKLADRLGATDRIVTMKDIDVVLETIGPVGSTDDRTSGAKDDRPPSVAASRPGDRRRLYRIREDQWIAGVSTGIAAYSEIGVEWVRTIFVLATLVTAGLFLLVYVALAFILPVVPTREAWIAAQRVDGAT